MRVRISYLLAVGVILAAASLVNAEITGWNCADDGDGKIVMGTPTWTDNGADYTLGMTCKQYGVPGDVGNIGGDFTTDTPTDPSVWIVETVDNYTNFAWSDYHIDIGMDKTFSINSVIAPLNWTYVITAPVSGQPLPLGGGTGWVGRIDYYVGTGSPIAINDNGDFGAKVSFLGSVAFSTAQVPTPEPATLALLSLGAMAIIRRKRA